jgi:hypothetical protein
LVGIEGEWFVVPALLAAGGGGGTTFLPAPMVEPRAGGKAVALFA